MHRSTRLALAVVALATLAMGTVATTAAGGPKVLDDRLLGIPTAGLVIDGITGGGRPWTIESGRARLFADGRLEVEVNGLVLGPVTGSPGGNNPIPNGRAVVACGGAAVAQSPIVPFSPTGDAHVSSTVALPADCLAPAVFFVGVTATGAQPWFAVTGF